MRNITFFILFSLATFHATANTGEKVLYGNLSDYTLKKDTLKTDNDTVTFKDKLDRFNAFMEKVIVYSPLPMISYSTETNWLFGLTKINAFRMGTKNQNDTTIQPSHITGLGYYTLNKQYKIAITANLMFGQNKYESFTQFLYINFPNLYFGVGNDNDIDRRCVVLTRNLAIEQMMGYRFAKNWYVGLKYDYNNYFKVDTVHFEGIPCDENIPDLTVNEGTQSGIGIRVDRETRDNRFNAKRGSYLFFEYQNFGKWIGSKFNYHSIIVEYRKYVTPLKWLTIAGQAYSEFKLGDVPVQSLAFMGGDNRMRGIYSGMFRDHTMIESQVEFRVPIYWIFGAVAFAGLGEVGPTLKSYTWEGIKFAYGAGLRLSVNEATRTNIRFDIGFYKVKPLFFFTFSEAF